MAKTNSLFQKIIKNIDSLELCLDEKKVEEGLIEFVWFFNGTNNVKFLLENNHYEYISLLYDKYCYEIDNLIKFYELSDIIEESEFFHGWFSNWRKLEKFNQNEFISKLKTDFEFSSLWGDFGVTDSLEFRNWGVEISFDAEDRGKISKKGKDQFRHLINTLSMNPENGLHILNFYNVNNLEERILNDGLLIIKFYCEKLKYEDRIKWFFENYFETGMELEILLENFKNQNLDSIKHYNQIISLPKYKLNIIGEYGLIKNNFDLDKKILFNSYFLKYISKLFNMVPNSIIINSLYGFKNKKIKTKHTYKIEIVKKQFESLNLELKDFKIINL